MALKPTIYKFRITLSDLNRDYYDSLNLTVAQHPSENSERMMARIVAYALNAEPELTFTKGLSTIEEPDIWVKSPDNRTTLWIEVGEPDPERVKKSTRFAERVLIYSFNTKSDVWWKQSADKLNLLEASVYQFDYEGIEKLVTLISRTTDMSIMLTGQSAFITTGEGDCEIQWTELKA